MNNNINNKKELKSELFNLAAEITILLSTDFTSLSDDVFGLMAAGGMNTKMKLSEAGQQLNRLNDTIYRVSMKLSDISNKLAQLSKQIE